MPKMRKIEDLEDLKNMDKAKTPAPSEDLSDKASEDLDNKAKTPAPSEDLSDKASEDLNAKIEAKIEAKKQRSYNEAKIEAKKAKDLPKKTKKSSLGLGFFILLFGIAGAVLAKMGVFDMINEFFKSKNAKKTQESQARDTEMNPDFNHLI